MTIKNLITSTIVSASIATGSLVPLAAPARADDWRHHDGYVRQGYYSYRDQGPAPQWNRQAHAPQWIRPAPVPQWNRNYDDNSYAYNNYNYRERHHRHHDNRNIVIGLTAIAIAAIIASQASEHDHR